MLLHTLLLLMLSDPWNTAELMQPAKLVEQLKVSNKPQVIYVGFPVLYKGAHIPGAEFAGPCSQPEGLAALAKVLIGTPRDKEIVIYCGCCPFVKCPNVRPAYSALKAAGYTHIHVLQLDTNLHTDWVEKGYPVDKSAQ
jgi:rhodanese-related sulfurtransferase